MWLPATGDSELQILQLCLFTVRHAWKVDSSLKIIPSRKPSPLSVPSGMSVTNSWQRSSGLSAWDRSGTTAVKKSATKPPELWHSVKASGRLVSRSQDSDGLLGRRPGVRSRKRQAIFLYSTDSRRNLGPTYLLSSGCYVPFFPGLKLTTHFHLVPKSRIVEI
jgi:hypothetical protein